MIFNIRKHIRITVGAEQILTLMKIKHKLREKVGKQWLKLQIQKTGILTDSTTYSLILGNYAIFMSFSFFICKNGDNMCLIVLLWGVNVYNVYKVPITKYVGNKHLLLSCYVIIVVIINLIIIHPTNFAGGKKTWDPEK